MATRISRAVLLVAGLGVTLDFFLKFPPLNTTISTIMAWIPLIVSFSVVIGGINVVLIHKDNIAKRKREWYHSLVLLAFFAITVFVGLTQGISSQTYTVLYYRVLVVCGNSLSGILAFFIASSAFRAFRANNLEAALLLVSGAAVMLGQVPFGVLLWKGFPALSDWIMNYPNLAAQRGILIASGVGFMAVSLRLIFGYSKIQGSSE